MANVMHPADRLLLLKSSARTFGVDPNIPLRRYFRGGQEMIRMASVNKDEGRYESAVILYTKFIDLFSGKIQQHPEYKKFSPSRKSVFEKKLYDVIATNTNLSLELLDKYKHEFTAQTGKHAEFTTQPIDADEFDLEAEDFPIDDLPPGLDDDSILDIGGYLSPSELESNDSDVFESFMQQPVDQDGLQPVMDPANPLVPVVVPDDLEDLFMRTVSEIVGNKTEACGLLLGKMFGNTFYVSHLVVPKQIGLLDRCTMLEQEDIVAVMQDTEAVVIGWINAKVGTELFMSSIDLHTHAEYTKTLPGAIGIVCVLEEKLFLRKDIYRLTKYGLEQLSQCTADPQQIHEHNTNEKLYEVAGHAKHEKHRFLTVIDLRKPIDQQVLVRGMPDFHTGLRDVIIPAQTEHAFMAIAEKRIGLATVGLLAGNLDSYGRYTVTQLIVPKQSDKQDVCEITDLEEVNKVLQEHEIITLGWIHLKQNADLTSHDLHSHIEWTNKLDEAFAYVCSLKQPSAIYFLTPYGLRIIRTCEANVQELHQHETQTPLYTEADHVKKNTKAHIAVVSLLNAPAQPDE